MCGSVVCIFARGVFHMTYESFAFTNWFQYYPEYISHPPEGTDNFWEKCVVAGEIMPNCRVIHWCISLSLMTVRVAFVHALCVSGFMTPPRK